MTISIRDRTTEELVRREAKRSGRTITQTVRALLEAQVKARGDDRDRRERELDAFLDEFHKHATGPAMTAQEFDDYLYDDHGLPR